MRRLRVVSEGVRWQNHGKSASRVSRWHRPDNRRISRGLNLEVPANFFLIYKITGGNQTTPGKPYPNTTEAGFMKVNDNAGSQRVAE
jgi:hypothetical protein